MESISRGKHDWCDATQNGAAVSRPGIIREAAAVTHVRPRLAHEAATPNWRSRNGAGDDWRSNLNRCSRSGDRIHRETSRMAFPPNDFSRLGEYRSIGNWTIDWRSVNRLDWQLWWFNERCYSGKRENWNSLKRRKRSFAVARFRTSRCETKDTVVWVVLQIPNVDIINLWTKKRVASLLNKKRKKAKTGFKCWH